MKKRIISELQKIEQDEQVRILYACESGSRAWGFPSRDSDYDVRFIYIHPLEWYLSIMDKRDVIELPVNDLLDINGWDIRKALKLLRKSNPPLLEWLRSPIIYEEKYSVAEKMRGLVTSSFSPGSCFHHYLSIARGNFREYLQGEIVKVKKYFYVLRPLLACRWIENNNSMPPMEFEKLTDSILPAGSLSNAISDLLRRKKLGEELALEPKIAIINDYIQEELSSLTDYASTLSHSNLDVKAFDEVFLAALDKVWGMGERIKYAPSESEKGKSD